MFDLSPVLLPSQLGPAEVEYSDARSILTKASGFIKRYNYTLNPYSGCGFGCDYCYARFFAPSDDRREAWGRWVRVKRNAAALVRRACERGKLVDGDAVYMSSVTDPYQPIESKLGLTRSILEAILEAGVQPRMTVQTRSPIVTRDIDLLRRFERLRVSFTVGTDSEAMRLRYEPHCASIARRFAALEELAAAGIRIGVAISPMLPIDDVEAFAARLAALDADEYVTQYFHTGSGWTRYAADTTAGAQRKALEDGWTLAAYEKTRDRLAALPGRPLLEGDEGFAPA